MITDLRLVCKDLHNRFLKKEITSAELAREGALLALHPLSWDELTLEDYLPKPKELCEYELLSITQKSKLSDEYKEQFKGYYRTKNTINGKNWSNYCWLKDMRDALKDDDICVKRIDERLDIFRSWLFKNARFYL